jgi:hypothetical protein
MALDLMASDHYIILSMVPEMDRAPVYMSAAAHTAPLDMARGGGDGMGLHPTRRAVALDLRHGSSKWT